MAEIMWSGVRRRIIDRLTDLDMTGADASRKIGKAPGYLYEFLGKPKGTGKRGRRSKEEMIESFSADDATPPKKESIRVDGLNAIAEVLDCDPEYLYGLQDDPRGEPIRPRLPLSGLLISGIAISPGKQGLRVNIPTGIRALEQYPVAFQRLFYIQDDHAAHLCLPAGSMVVSVPIDQAGRSVKDEDIVIVSRWNGSMVEMTARRVILKDGQIIVEFPKGDEAGDYEISGLVVFQARYTG